MEALHRQKPLELVFCFSFGAGVRKKKVEYANNVPKYLFVLKSFENMQIL